MRLFSRGRWWWYGCAGLLLAAVSLVPLLLAALDAGYFRAELIGFLEARFHRRIHIEGLLQVQLWSRHPRLIAQQVIVENPPWVAPGEMARAGRVTLQYSAPSLGRAAVLESVILENATLHLERDGNGHANWHRTDSLTGHGGVPLIQELSAENVHLVLNDALGHRQFDGMVRARGPWRPTPQRLHIEGQGQLNGKATTLQLDGDPLAATRRGVAYHWEFSEQSSGTHLQVRGTLPQPYDFDVVDAQFDAAGEDLKDLYYATGVSLVHTGAYRLSGDIQRRGALTRFESLHLTTGQSEVDGQLASTLSKERPTLTGELHATRLRSADFGARAAGDTLPAQQAVQPHLFSDAAYNPAALRRTDTLLHFSAARVELGRLALQALEGQFKVDHGVVSIAPLTAQLLQGSVDADVTLDANQDTPIAQVSLQLGKLQLAELARKDAQPPVEGLLQARVEVAGRGRSLHQVAMSATGVVSASLPGGALRASLAEIAGVDLRGLGLTLAHAKRDVDVRCAAAVFAAHEGTLTSRTLVIDTEPVLITGEGDIRLDSEELHLTLRGQPKDVRLLRLDAPLEVQGTLTRPTIKVQTHDSSLKLVDPGKGKDVDCAQLLAQTRPKPARYGTPPLPSN